MPGIPTVDVVNATLKMIPGPILALLAIAMAGVLAFVANTIIYDAFSPIGMYDEARASLTWGGAPACAQSEKPTCDLPVDIQAYIAVTQYYLDNCISRVSLNYQGCELHLLASPGPNSSLVVSTQFPESQIRNAGMCSFAINTCLPEIQLYPQGITYSNITCANSNYDEDLRTWQAECAGNGSGIYLLDPILWTGFPLLIYLAWFAISYYSAHRS